ncbi:hypothetical protein [Lentibacillus sp. CBA3610]|nr:hypothetical protein [Lentibacillus sp. CBA3610]
MEEIARKLGAKGAQIIVADINMEKAEKTVSILEKDNVEANAVYVTNT